MLNSRNLRVLIVSKKQENAFAADELRHGRFAAALEEISVPALHVSISRLRDLECAVHDFAPSVVFASFFRLEDPTWGRVYLERVLAKADIGWIGSDWKSMELVLCKHMSKLLWQNAGILTPEWFLVESADVPSIEDWQGASIAMPCIVKPAREGNSRGIDKDSVVWSASSLVRKAHDVAVKYSGALVERFVSGNPDSQEFTAAMIGNGAHSIVAAIEIRKNAPDALTISENDKVQRTSSLHPVTDQVLASRITELARRVFSTSNIHDYARCDMLYDLGKLYVIEVNGQPMMPDRWFSACAAEAGLSEAESIRAVVLAGLARLEAMSPSRFAIPGGLLRSVPEDARNRIVPCLQRGWLHAPFCEDAEPAKSENLQGAVLH